MIRVLGRTRAFLRVVGSKPKGITVAVHLNYILPFVRDSIATFIPMVSGLLGTHLHRMLGIKVQFEQSGLETGLGLSPCTYCPCPHALPTCTRQALEQQFSNTSRGWGGYKQQQNWGTGAWGCNTESVLCPK